MNQKKPLCQNFLHRNNFYLSFKIHYLPARLKREGEKRSKQHGWDGKRKREKKEEKATQPIPSAFLLPILV